MEIQNITQYAYWKGQLIKIIGGGLMKTILLGNVCRPPNDSNASCKQFTDNFTAFMQSMHNNNSEIIFTGDFNINLLNINEKDKISDIFDNLTANSFFLKITHPTRLTNYNGTLNFVCKLSETTLNSTAGILTNKFKISNHIFFF